MDLCARCRLVWRPVIDFDVRRCVAYFRKGHEHLSGVELPALFPPHIHLLAVPANFNEVVRERRHEHSSALDHAGIPSAVASGSTTALPLHSSSRVSHRPSQAPPVGKLTRPLLRFSRSRDSLYAVYTHVTREAFKLGQPSPSTLQFLEAKSVERTLSSAQPLRASPTRTVVSPSLHPAPHVPSFYCPAVRTLRAQRFSMRPSSSHCTLYCNTTPLQALIIRTPSTPIPTPFLLRRLLHPLAHIP